MVYVLSTPTTKEATKTRNGAIVVAEVVVVVSVVVVVVIAMVVVAVVVVDIGSRSNA